MMYLSEVLLSSFRASCFLLLTRSSIRSSEIARAVGVSKDACGWHRGMSPMRAPGVNSRPPSDAADGRLTPDATPAAAIA
jgi:hypothetical protein